MKLSRSMWWSVVLLAVVGFGLFPGAGRDDKYITFWPAYTLSEFGEMLNYNGMRVEQSSSLLFVLLLAGLRTLTGASLVILGYGAAIASGIAALIATGIVGRRLGSRTGALAMLLLATSTYFAYWTFGSMEVPLVGLLSLGMVGVLQMAAKPALRTQYWVLAALVLLSYTLVRPESPFVMVCTLGFSALFALLDHVRLRTAATHGVLRNVTVVCLLGVTAVAVVMAFRFAYFGSAFPQPVVAKTHVSGLGALLKFVRSGIGYLQHSPGAFLLAGLAALGLVGFVRGLRGQMDLLRAPLVGFVLAYGGFTLFSGGDWMEGGRFIAHMTPVAAILAADGLLRGLPVYWHRPAVAFMLAAQLGFSVYFAHASSMSVPLWRAFDVSQIGVRNFHWIERINREHRRDTAVIEVLDGVLSKLPPRPLAQRPHVLSYNVGMVMFYLTRDHPDRMAVIDLHGLSDRYVTDSPYRNTIPTWALGLIWGMGHYLRDHDQFAADTGVPYPSLMYWENSVAQGGDVWPEKFGFSTYLAQRGRVSPEPDAWFHGRSMVANQFLSVSESLRNEAGLGDGYLYLDMEHLLASPGESVSSVIEREPASLRL